MISFPNRLQPLSGNRIQEKVIRKKERGKWEVAKLFVFLFPNFVQHLKNLIQNKKYSLSFRYLIFAFTKPNSN